MLGSIASCLANQGSVREWAGICIRIYIYIFSYITHTHTDEERGSARTPYILKKTQLVHDLGFGVEGLLVLKG